jgi:hypothetical protein
VRGELGFNAAGGVFGPGFRPNATVARSVGLIVRNVFGVQPHVLEQATQGLPGRWSICIAENEEESPWEPLATEMGLEPNTNAVSCTLTRTYEFVDNRHTQSPEHLLWDFADTISRTGVMIFRAQSAGIVFCPEHAQMLAGAGYSKNDVKDWLIEHCGRIEADLRRAGKDAVSEGGFGARSAGDVERVAGDVFTPFLPGRQSVPIIVAGARNAAISMVFRVFGEWSNTSVQVEPARTPVAAVISSESEGGCDVARAGTEGHAGDARRRRVRTRGAGRRRARRGRHRRDARGVRGLPRPARCDARDPRQDAGRAG